MKYSNTKTHLMPRKLIASIVLAAFVATSINCHCPVAGGAMTKLAPQGNIAGGLGAFKIEAVRSIIERTFGENKGRLGPFAVEDERWESAAEATAEEIGKLGIKFTFTELELIHKKYPRDEELFLYFWLIREILEADYSAYDACGKPLKVALVLVNNHRDTNTVNEPLGIEILKGVLKKRFGRAVEITLLLLQAEAEKDIIAKIEKLSPDILGISLDYYAWDKMMRIASVARSLPNRPELVIGNIGAALAYKEILQGIPEALVCMGEGEDAIAGIAARHIDRQMGFRSEIDAIPNLAYYKDSRMHRTPKQPVPIQFTGIPSYEFIPLVLATNGQSLSQFSLGCRYNCTFCTRMWLYGRRNTSRRIKVVLEEITEKSKRGVSFINFSDDNMAHVDFQKLWKLADGVINLKRRGAIASNMEFGVSATADGVVAIENERRDGISLLERLVAAGFKTFYVGIESGVKDQLRADYNKTATVAVNIEALKIMRDRGILCIAGFITLDPRVTLKEIKENLVFCRENGIDGSIVYAPKTLTILPHTALPVKYKEQIAGTLNRNTLSFEYVYDGPDADAIAEILFILKQWEESHTDAYWGLKELKRSGKYGTFSAQTRKQLSDTMQDLGRLLFDYFEALVDTHLLKGDSAEKGMRETEEKFSKKLMESLIDILAELEAREDLTEEMRKFVFLFIKGIVREAIRVFFDEAAVFSSNDISAFLNNTFLSKANIVSKQDIEDVLIYYRKNGMLSQPSTGCYKKTDLFEDFVALPFVDLPRPSKSQWKKMCDAIGYHGELSEEQLRKMSALRELAHSRAGSRRDLASGI